MQSSSNLSKPTRLLVGALCTITLGACFHSGLSEPQTAVGPASVPVVIIGSGGYPLGYGAGSTYLQGAYISGNTLYSAQGWPIGYLNPSVYGYGLGYGLDYGLGYGARRYYLRSRAPYYGQRYWSHQYGAGMTPQTGVRVAPRPRAPVPPRALPPSRQPHLSQPSATKAAPPAHKR